MSRMSLTEVLQLAANAKIINDESAIRDIIGLLFGVKSGPNKVDSDYALNIRRNDCVSGISLKCSRNYLDKWSKYGDDMKSLFNILYPDQECEDDVFDSLSTTLLAYLHALRAMSHDDLLRPFVKETDDYYQENSLYKLDTFFEYITSPSNSRLYQKINLLGQIHKEIIESEKFQFNYKCTSHLINVAYKYLDLDLGDIREIAWRLFLSVLRPTLFNLESLIRDGVSNDLTEEFMFNICPISVTHNETFWEDCVQVRDEDAIPDVLKPIIGKILLGIRSRLVLLACGIEVNHSNEAPALFESFKKQVCKFEEISSPRYKEVECRNKQQFSLQLEPFPNQTPYDVTYHGTSAYFKELLDLPNQDVERVCDNAVDVDFSLPPDSKVPLKLALERSIELTIDSYVAKSCQDLISAFKDSYLSHIRVFNDYYLMHQSSHCISLYFNTLFAQITNLPPLKKGSPQMMTDYHFDDTVEIKAFFLQAAQESRDPLKIVECLHLFYDEMDLFSKLLLNTAAVQIYDDAFHFLIILKYSKWLLENLSFQSTKHCLNGGGDNEDAKSVQHQLHLIRFKFLGIINELHYNVMNRLDDQISLLNDKTGQALDFEEMRGVLAKFLKEVSRCTFQDTNHKKVVYKIYSTAAKICKNWEIRSWDMNNNADLAKEGDRIKEGVKFVETLVRWYYAPTAQ